MDKEKKIIFGFVILTIFLLILAIFAISAMQKIQKEKMTSKTAGIYSLINEKSDIDKPTQNQEEVLKKITNDYEYMCVKNCIDTYHKSIKKALADKLENTSEIYGLLDNQYIEFKGITRSNIKEKIPYDKFSFVINEVYKKEELNTNIEYLVEGNLINETTEDVIDYKYLIRMDLANNLYAVILDDFIGEKDISFENFEIENKEIENTPYNHLSIESINNNKIAITLYNDFKTRVMYNTDSACKKVNQEYYQKRFESQEELKDYLENNIKITDSEIMSYKAKEYDNNRFYFISDKDNKIYIFQVTDLNSYTVMLDDYTIDIEEKIIAEQNNNNLNSEEEKIERFINKIERAINEKNYNYLYNNLNEKFKENNYKSKEKLQEYLEENFYENTSLELKSYKNLVEENGIYVIEAYVTDKSEDINWEAETEFEFAIVTFMLHLNEDGSFEYSFSIEK